MTNEINERNAQALANELQAVRNRMDKMEIESRERTAMITTLQSEVTQLKQQTQVLLTMGAGSGPTTG